MYSCSVPTADVNARGADNKVSLVSLYMLVSDHPHLTYCSVQTEPCRTFKLSAVDVMFKLSAVDAMFKLSAIDTMFKLSAVDTMFKLSAIDTMFKLSAVDAMFKLSAVDV